MLQQTIARAGVVVLVASDWLPAGQQAADDRGCEMNDKKLACELCVDRLPVVDFDLEAQILDHAPDLGCRLAWCREVPVHEDGVGWVERERLEAAEVVFPSSGDAEFSVRVEKSEETEHF